MRAIDTNTLVRLITRDDSKQTEAAETFIAKGAWVSHVVLAESVWVLGSVYDLDARQIVSAIDMLLRHNTLSLQDPDVVENALVKFRASPSIGFTDFLILETARKAGHHPLGTFDRDLATSDGAERIRPTG